jgi:hypothetical protein
MSDQNDEQHELDRIEALLQQMPLRSPSRDLDGRIAATLAPRRWNRWVIGLTASSLAAAAAVLLALLPQTKPPAPPTVAQSTTPPVSQTEVVQTTAQWTDEGIVATADDGPIRQYRVEVLKEIWHETENGPSVLTIPEEQVVYVQAQAY